MFNPLHKLRTIAGLAGTAALLSAGVAGAFVPPGPPDHVTVPLPGVPKQQLLEVCLQDDGELEPSCKVLATPDITGGELTMSWGAARAGSVTATPVAPNPSQCGGRKGAFIRAAATDEAVGVVIELHASYNGVSTPSSEMRSQRTISMEKGTSTWVCLL